MGCLTACYPPQIFVCPATRQGAWALPLLRVVPCQAAGGVVVDDGWCPSGTPVTLTRGGGDTPHHKPIMAWACHSPINAQP